MKLLPELAALFDVSVSDLLCEEDEPKLSANEQQILTMFRAASGLSEREKAALTETIRNTIDLYLASREGEK